MPGPIDDTLKHLTELSPQDWVVQGGWPAAPTGLIDADIATITGATDKVIRVAGPPDWLLAVDFQSGHDSAKLPPKMLLYNAALRNRHELPVRSLAVVLHRGADSPQLNGLYESGLLGEPPDVTLRYRVLRVWQVPAERWLSGGLGVLPLAPLGDVREAELPGVIARMKRRLDREERNLAAELWSAVYILMGVRYEDALIEALLQGVRAVEESVTYQKIVRKGKAEGLRTALLLLGPRRLGEPSVEAVAALEAVTDVQKLEEMTARLDQAASWQELLGLNGPGPRRRGRKKTS
jgi:hypothetical protein